MIVQRGLAFLLLCLLPFVTGFGPAYLTESDQPHFPIYAGQLRSFSPPPALPLAAAAGVVLDDASGRVLYSYHGSDHRPPASTTKIMTALLALERGRLTDRITARAGVFGSLTGTGSSIMGVQYGDEFSLEELLYGLLLPSGNDAALLIAELISGSVESFVQLMNSRAAELGLEDSHFANPHGLDAPDHYMSAADLAVVTREAMRHAIFRKIVATRLYTIERPRQLFLLNTNRLIDSDQYPGFDGVKTGYTELAGQCLVATLARNGRRVITVVLGSENRDRDASRLANYAYESFPWVELPPPTPLPFLADDGQIYKLVHSTPPGFFAQPWQVPYLRPLYAIERRVPGSSRAPIGEVQYQIGGIPLLEYPLLPAPWGTS